MPSILEHRYRALMSAEPDAPTPAELFLQMLARPTWMADAACRETPSVSFFPERGQDARPAKAVCARCLVRAECLAFAEACGRDIVGIWGGTSERERRGRRSGRRDAA
jgi:WhiB family transcriptional regulator, redox-sensing transcriptional regulator